MIRYAFEHNIFTCVATNGHYKHRINDAFLDSHLDHITVAVDGADNDTYVNYRAGGRLPTVLDNVRDLLRKRDQRKLGHPFVELQFLVFENNLHQVKAIHKLARALNVDGLLIRAAEGPDNASVLSRYYTWDNDRDFCSRFWYTATIASDGGVVPCCNYFYKRDDFGNVSSAPFSVVWHNSTFQRNRRIVAKKNFENLPEICKTCKVYCKEQANFPIWNSDA